MDWEKIQKVILNRQFKYHKEISAEICYALIEKYSNERNEELHKKFRFSYLETPFYEISETKYSFSIGPKTLGRCSEIYGYVDENDNVSIIKVKIQPELWKKLLLGFLFIILLWIIIHGSLIAIIILMTSLVGMFIWSVIESVCLLNLFEDILGRF